VAGQAGLGFGGLLRQLRDDARLTQEELAEAAQVSPRAVSDLERGINRTARKDTALLLAGALGLDGEARELFVAAARGRGSVEAVLAARQAAPPRGVCGGGNPGAAANHQQALALFSDLGNLLGQAEALNRLGELSSRTSATARARDYHNQALVIARDIRASPEEARP